MEGVFQYSRYEKEKSDCVGNRAVQQVMEIITDQVNCKEPVRYGWVANLSLGEKWFNRVPQFIEAEFTQLNNFIRLGIFVNEAQLKKPSLFAHVFSPEV